MSASPEATVDTSDTMEANSTQNQSNASKSQKTDSSAKPTEEALARKKQIICFISDAHVQLHNAIMKGIDAELENISIGIQVHDVLDATYNILREKQSGATASPAQQQNTTYYTVMHLDKKNTIQHSDAEALVIQAAIKNKLEFKHFEPGNQENWHESASTFISTLTCFSLRMKELEIGNFFITLEKKDGGIRRVPISDFGLSGFHRVLMDGCTFPPEKRISMIPCLGPMTIFIDYVEFKGSQFQEMWKAAAKRLLTMFKETLRKRLDPYPETIDSDGMLRDMHAEPIMNVKPLFVALANLWLISPIVSLCMCPPPNIFAKIFQTNEFEMNSETFSKDQIIEAFNFSGHGAFIFYKIMSDTKWQVNEAFTESEARQVIYHSMFGTWKEDLSILAQITDEKNWLTYKELFQNFKQNTSKTVCTFTPVQQIYYS